MLWSTTAGAVQEERLQLLNLFRLTDNAEVFPVFGFLRVQSQAVPLDTGLGWQLLKLSSVPNTPRDGHREAVTWGALQSAHKSHYEDQRDDHCGSLIQEDKHLVMFLAPSSLSAQAKSRT